MVLEHGGSLGSLRHDRWRNMARRGPSALFIITTLSFSASVLMLTVAWWIAHTIRHPPQTFFQDQLPGITHKAELVPPNNVMVIGDSITASNYFLTLCGRPAFNAGIGWATSHDWAPHVADLVRRARPSIIVIALGNNDIRSDWKDDYRRIAKFGTFAVTPKQPDKAAFIRSLLPSVPVPSQTYDGTHLNKEGAREWVRRIEDECRKLKLYGV